MSNDNERRWRERYDPDVPRTLEPYPDRTMLDYLAENAREAPGDPAILFKGRTLSWREIEAESHAAALAFRAMGVVRGDRVALLLPNCPQFFAAEFGAWMCGAVVCPLNPIYTTDEIADRLRTLSPKVVVTLNPFYERVGAARAGTAVQAVVTTNIKDYFPPLLKLAFTLLMERKLGHRATPRAGDVAWTDWLRPWRGKRWTDPAPRPEDDALILMSGGTTGTPKGVPAWHRGLVYPGKQLRAWFGESFVVRNAPILLPLPLFHSYGAVVAQPLSLIARSPLALVPNPRDLDDLVQTFRRVRPALFAGVPALYNALLNHPAVKSGRVDFSSLRIAACGAAPLMAETKRRFEEVTGAKILEAYALTESLITAIANPYLGERKVGSVGIPVPDVHMKIVDAEDGRRELPNGDVGEIVLRGPQIMRGYFGEVDESAAMLATHDDGHRWLHTADLGYIDHDGYLFIVDRKKDLIKANGMQVWPREIEEVLARHPAVAEVGVRGFADAARGEIAVAFVVLRAGVQATEQDLRAFCKEHLAYFKVPARVMFRPDLPKSLVGKVLRRMLTLEDPPVRA